MPPTQDHAAAEKQGELPVCKEYPDKIQKMSKVSVRVKSVVEKLCVECYRV